MCYVLCMCHFPPPLYFFSLGRTLGMSLFWMVHTCTVYYVHVHVHYCYCIVQVAMMLESTYVAVHSSFRALLGVAQHFSRLRCAYVWCTWWCSWKNCSVVCTCTCTYITCCNCQMPLHEATTVCMYVRITLIILTMCLYTVHTACTCTVHYVVCCGFLMKSCRQTYCRLKWEEALCVLNCMCITKLCAFNIECFLLQNLQHSRVSLIPPTHAQYTHNVIIIMAV